MVFNSSLEATSFSSEEMNWEVYLTVAVSLGLISVFGVALNVLVAVVIIKDSQLHWNPSNIVHLNLVIVDLFVAIIGNPIAMGSAIAGGWYWRYEVCLGYAWFMSTLTYAGIGNLTVMAVERWLLVTHPTWIFTRRHAKILICCVWIYAYCLSLPPLLGWGKYGLEAGNISCSVSWHVHDPITNSGFYIAFIFTVGLVIPLLIMVTSYTSVVLTLMTVKNRTAARRRRDAKVTMMVALMITAFLISWAPYATLALAAHYFHFKPSPWIVVSSTLLAKSSICLNPIIYAGLSTHFACSLKRLFGRDNTNAMLNQQRQGIALRRLSRSYRDVNIPSGPRAQRESFAFYTL